MNVEVAQEEVTRVMMTALLSSLSEEGKKAILLAGLESFLNAPGNQHGYEKKTRLQLMLEESIKEGVRQIAAERLLERRAEIRAAVDANFEAALKEALKAHSEAATKKFSEVLQQAFARGY